MIKRLHIVNTMDMIKNETKQVIQIFDIVVIDMIEID